MSEGWRPHVLLLLIPYSLSCYTFGGHRLFSGGKRTTADCARQAESKVRTPIRIQQGHSGQPCSQAINSHCETPSERKTEQQLFALPRWNPATTWPVLSAVLLPGEQAPHRAQGRSGCSSPFQSADRVQADHACEYSPPQTVFVSSNSERNLALLRAKVFVVYFLHSNSARMKCLTATNPAYPCHNHCRWGRQWGVALAKLEEIWFGLNWRWFF